MTASDAAGGGVEPQRDAIQALAEIVSQGHAAVTVLIDELRDGLNPPVDVRPLPSESEDVWAEQIADALGEAQGRVLAVTAERPGLAARVALGLSARLVDMGAPVTVVDGSIEEPVFAKGLPEDGDEGLVDAVLFGVSSSTVARRTLMHGVRLVTAGSYPISVPAVLGADAYRTTLEKLAREDATVILVIPASYAPVAAAAASQLVIVADELPVLETLTRDLRSAADLRDVRFVAVLSAPEPVHEEQVPVQEVPPAVVDEASEEAIEVESAETAEAPDETDTTDKVPDEEVTREPALVSASTAFITDPAPEQERDDSPTDGGSLAGRRWGAWITVIVILLIAGVTWRTGVLDAIFGGDDRDSIVAATQQDTETVVPGGEVVHSGTVTASIDSTETAQPVAREEAEVLADAAQEEPHQLPDTQVRDWRALAVSTAVPGRYVVFTSSHRLTSAADRDARTLERRGFPSTVVTVDIPERGTWHRVLVDAGFRTLDDTRELLDSMKEVGYEGAWIERLREPAPPVVAPPDMSDQWMDGDSAPQ